MSRYITEDDTPLDYSSEPDEFESEQTPDLLWAAEPFEIYIGNTGKVHFEMFYSLFKQHGVIKDMIFWRTHDHLYHCRIVYRSQVHADKAIKLMNHRKVYFKRIRVTNVKDRINLDFPAAVRIDEIRAHVTEEDIFDHFISCGEIRFVIKTGYAAYIQFAASSSAAQALGLKKILNGDPYMLTRISADDRIDHIQVIENMKNIKYRKPFVMVENYPELPKGTPLCQYKSKFEPVGSVRHFKVAPTANGTVTLALCMDSADDRDLVIDRFNDTIVNGKRLKLYMAPGSARMTVKHVTKYAVCKNSIIVQAIRPYFKEYDVCRLFKKCGSISFLEKIETRWIICFDNPSAVSLACSFHVFTLYNKELSVKELNQETLYFKGETLEDPDAHKNLPEPDKNKPNPNPGLMDNYLIQAVIKMDQNIKQYMKQLGGAKKQQTPVVVVVQPQPSTSQPAKKRPANDIGSVVPPARARLDSTNDSNSLMEDSNDNKFLVIMSNLPKGIEKNDLRVLFREYELENVTLFGSKDLYHPTTIAYVRLTLKKDERAVLRHHHGLYRGKRICVMHSQRLDWVFLPEKTVMLKNLPKNVTEEDIVEEVEKCLGLKVVDIIKPAHHYAYFDFTDGVEINEKLLNSLQNAMARIKIDVLPLYNKLPKMWMGDRTLVIQPIDRMRALHGAILKEEEEEEEDEDADKNFGVHNAHKLFIGNIPRDTEAEDVIDYFNNFGSVIDYAPVETKSCYLRKSAILSFVNSKHAQNAYCQQPHFLEGSVLDMHLMDAPPVQCVGSRHFSHLTVKFHSPFLTNDEIRYALQKMVNVHHSIRFDAFDDRANYVAYYRFTKRMEGAMDVVFNTQYINDEAVKIVPGYDPSPPTEDEAREKWNISDSPHRQQKEKYLNFTIYKENLKDEMEVRTRPSKEADIPFTSFYNDNTVQINNVSLDTTLEDIRDLFIKCGDIVDYRALLLEEDATKICYVHFKIDLAADLACMYNQRMLNGKRILVHLAKETLHVERDRSILVERLSPSTTAEQLHDAFTTIGTVKYVQKQSPCSAIVCFKDKNRLPMVVNVTIIPNSESFLINPCDEEYDPQLFNYFSCKKEFIPVERMRAVLRPRVLPEFHQLELDRQVFETLPDDIKTRMLNEVFLARQKVPNFNRLSKHEQIDALKTQYLDFTQKEHFLRLSDHEQEKLLDVTSNLQHDYPYEDVLPPKRVSAANRYFDPSEEPEPTPDQYPFDLEPPGGWMGLPRSGDMFPHGPGPRFPGMYPELGPPFFAGGMPPPFGDPNQQSLMGPGPGPMMRYPMGMRPPMDGMPPDSRWMQERLDGMAYNAGPTHKGRGTSIRHLISIKVDP